MEIKKYTGNMIAEALKSDRVKNCDTAKLNNTIARAVGDACQIIGHQFHAADINFIVLRMLEILREDYPAMRIEEFPIAVRKGAMGEYGEFFGINVATVTGFVKAYMASEKRSQQVALLHQPSEKKLPSAEEIEKMETDMIIMAFEKFKKQGHYEDFGNHVYHKLDARGLITFTNDVKHGFMKQARQNIESRNNPATASSLPERNKMLAFLEQLEAGDASSEAVIKSEAKKVALTEYFRGLVEMGIEIKELLTN